MFDTSLDASVDEEVVFRFSVRNVDDDPVELTFRDAGHADVAVFEDDEEVWRWSDGRMFAQVVQTTRLEGGEETTFEVSWSNPHPGDYVAEATLRVREVDVSARTSFSV